jgi:hypothetical protein
MEEILQALSQNTFARNIKDSFNQEVTLDGYCAFLDFWVAWLLLQPGFLLLSKVAFKEELKKEVL